MHLKSMLTWAEKVLTVLDDPRLVAPSLCSADRLHTKFGWLREHRKDLEVWSSWLALTDAALDIVRRRGYCRSTADDVKQALSELSDTPEKGLLKHERLVPQQLGADHPIEAGKTSARLAEQVGRKPGRTLDNQNPTFSTCHPRPGSRIFGLALSFMPFKFKHGR